MDEQQKLNLILMGPQGSGKGTQGELLSERLGIPLLVTGDLFRAHIALGTYLGQLAEQTIHAGDLMPDDITRELVDNELAQLREQGVIIDGYPRNVKQAEDLDKMLTVDYLIYLHVPDAVTVERISNRRTCAAGHVYNLISKPPRTAGVCDHDQLPLEVRADDQPQAIQRRLDIYHTQTEPVIDHYRKQGKLLQFDASDSIEMVHEAIVRRLQAVLE